MVGVEMDIDVTPLIQADYEHGVLMINAGPNVLRLLPPLIVEETHIDHFIDTLQTILTEIADDYSPSLPGRSRSCPRPV